MGGHGLPSRCCPWAPSARLSLTKTPSPWQVPLDGVIVEGEALVSLEHLTGEAAPVRRQVLDDVPGGSISTDGLLTIQV